MLGENLIKLKGYVRKIELKTVGDHGSKLFKSLIAIPVDEKENKYQTLRISSFNDAEALGELAENTPIYIEGHIEDRSFNVRCKHCQAYDKRSWFEIVVDNFIVLEKDNKNGK